jgi:hypothetical protein
MCGDRGSTSPGRKLRHTEVIRRAGVSKLRVALAAPVYGGGRRRLLRDKTRKPGKAQVVEAAVARLIARTLGKSVPLRGGLSFIHRFDVA